MSAGFSIDGGLEILPFNVITKSLSFYCVCFGFFAARPDKQKERNRNKNRIYVKFTVDVFFFFVKIPFQDIEKVPVDCYPQSAFLLKVK